MVFLRCANTGDERCVCGEEVICGTQAISYRHLAEEDMTVCPCVFEATDDLMRLGSLYARGNSIETVTWFEWAATSKSTGTIPRPAACTSQILAEQQPSGAWLHTT